jgi:60 kDa SS-A/Ro ribonucleoprotein
LSKKTKGVDAPFNRAGRSPVTTKTKEATMQNIATFVQATKGSNHGRDHVTNHAGAPAYLRSLREQTVQVLATGTFGDTFYATGKQLAAEAMEVLLKARTECPEFLARALVWAREKGFMRTLPVTGLAILSGGRGATKALFEAVFPRVIRTPDDLRAFTALCVAGTIPGRNGLGGVAVAAVRKHMNTLGEYHAVKYGSAASREMTLRDVLRLSHPHPTDAALEERFGWLVGGVQKLGSNPALNPRIRAFETLKRATTEDAQIALIREGGLPFEAVIPALGATTPRIWAELLRQAPYMNLLRNLVTFTRHGVFKDEANVQYAVRRLTDQRAIEGSKVFPFRYWNAWKKYVTTEDSDSRLADALREALERSFVNVPSFGNRVVAIGTDVSGSMNGQVSEKGPMRFIDIAGVFTGALLRRVQDRVIPLPFSTRVRLDCGLSARDEILTTAEKISQLGGGGTAVGAPVEYLLDRKIKADVFVGITDSEDWAYGNGHSCSGSFVDLWRRYRSQVSPEARAYLVTIAPYRAVVAPSGEKGVRFIYGWSDAVLKFIVQDLDAGFGQVREIEGMNLGTAAEMVGEPTESDEDAQTESE